MENSCGCRTGMPVVIRETSTPTSLRHDAKLSRKLFASVIRRPSVISQPITGLATDPTPTSGFPVTSRLRHSPWRRLNSEQPLGIAVRNSLAVGSAHRQPVEEGARLRHWAIGMVGPEHDPVDAQL